MPWKHKFNSKRKSNRFQHTYCTCVTPILEDQHSRYSTRLDSRFSSTRKSLCRSFSHSSLPPYVSEATTIDFSVRGFCFKFIPGSVCWADNVVCLLLGAKEQLPSHLALLLCWSRGVRALERGAGKAKTRVNEESKHESSEGRVLQTRSSPYCVNESFRNRVLPRLP